MIHRIARVLGAVLLFTATLSAQKNPEAVAVDDDAAAGLCLLLGTLLHHVFAGHDKFIAHICVFIVDIASHFHYTSLYFECAFESTPFWPRIWDATPQHLRGHHGNQDR